MKPIRIPLGKLLITIRWPGPPERPVPIVTADKFEFHMEEYKQLRAEGQSQLARIETLLRYSLVVSALVYAWLIVQAFGFNVAPGGRSVPCLRLPHEILTFGWQIPPAFVVLAGLGALITRWRVGQMGSYLHKLERALGRPPELGWEAFLKTKLPTVTVSAIVVWGLLLATTFEASTLGQHVTLQAHDQGHDIACTQQKDPGH